MRHAPLRIALSTYNDVGALAELENGDESVDLCRISHKRDGKQACLEAAKLLRAMAARFELLAEEEDLFLATTQDRINGTPSAGGDWDDDWDDHEDWDDD